MNANDMEKTIEIPEGYEARIEGNKVILERKENEDDRIRKEMITFLTYGIWSDATIDKVRQSQKYAKWIAYLERQKPVQDKEEREYVRTIKSLIADFLRDKEDVNRGYYQDIYDWLDGRHIERQPVNNIYMEGYMDGHAKGFKNAEDSYNRGVSYHFDNPNIQRLDPNVVIESKTGEMHSDVVRGTLTGGESIEDKDAIEVTPKQDYSGLTDFERAIHRGFLCAGVENVPVSIIKDTAQDCLAQIKPVEWSEEDVEKLAKIRASKSGVLTSEMTFYRQGVRDAFNYKGLRPSWKPSEEQVYSLGTVVKGYDNCTVGSVGYNLKELYEQLRKLLQL